MCEPYAYSETISLYVSEMLSLITIVHICDVWTTWSVRATVYPAISQIEAVRDDLGSGLLVEPNILSGSTGIV
jgi:hypothetical protein